MLAKHSASEYEDAVAEFKSGVGLTLASIAEKHHLSPTSLSRAIHRVDNGGSAAPNRMGGSRVYLMTNEVVDEIRNFLRKHPLATNEQVNLIRLLCLEFLTRFSCDFRSNVIFTSPLTFTHT
ncbi:MAG: hypothetical protein ACK56I_00605, partial [bacterium]